MTSSLVWIRTTPCTLNESRFRYMNSERKEALSKGGTMIEVPPHLDKYTKLFEEHLATLDRLQVIVLNGHLIVESAIDNIIALMLFHPEHIHKARLEFSQKVQLVRGYALRKNKNGIWALILTIGEVRNEVAHNLTEARQNDKMAQLRRLYFREAPEMVELHKDSSDEEIAYCACGLCAGFLGTLEHDSKSLRRLIDGLDAVLNPEERRVQPKE
jgi:hypothetical protein